MLSNDTSDRQNRKKKRGRPKKQKNKQGRPRKKNRVTKKQLFVDGKSNPASTVDLTSAKVDGLLATARRTQVTRVNWDSPKNAALRERIRKSWESKSDLYKQGDSFSKFCVRNAINRHVLLRYMKRKESGEPAKKRGRKTLLSMDVMRHLCEGQLLILHLLFSICS